MNINEAIAILDHRKGAEPTSFYSITCTYSSIYKECDWVITYWRERTGAPIQPHGDCLQSAMDRFDALAKIPTLSKEESISTANAALDYALCPSPLG